MIIELFVISKLLRQRSSTTPTQAQRPDFFGWQSSTKETTDPLPKPVGKTFAESLTALQYPEGWDATQVVVNLDPADVAAFREQERIKQALRL